MILLHLSNIRNGWNLGKKHSLWGQFLKAKYCNRDNTVGKKYGTGESLVWRYLIKYRQDVESHTSLNIHSGGVFGGIIGLEMEP